MSPEFLPVAASRRPLAGGRLWAWTGEPARAGTYTAARAASRRALTTADLVLAGVSAVGFAAPGPTPLDRWRFYCFFNNAAIARKRSLGHRRACRDPDVAYHHGQRTQQLRRRGDVFYFSTTPTSPAIPFFLADAKSVARVTAPARRSPAQPVALSDEGYLAAIYRALSRRSGTGPLGVRSSRWVSTRTASPRSSTSPSRPRSTTRWFRRSPQPVATRDPPGQVVLPAALGTTRSLGCARKGAEANRVPRAQRRS